MNPVVLKNIVVRLGLGVSKLGPGLYFFLKKSNGLKTPIIFCINVSNLILKKNFFREGLNSTKKKLS